jgi:hypothetical protein
MKCNAFNSSNSGNGLAGGVNAVEQPVTRGAARAADRKAAGRSLRANIAHQPKVAVGRPVELKHHLAASRAVLPAAHNTIRFSHAGMGWLHKHERPLYLPVYRKRPRLRAAVIRDLSIILLPYGVTGFGSQNESIKLAS